MDPTAPDPGAAPTPDPRISGPLDRATALAFLEIGDRLLEAGEFDAAGGYYQRVIGHDNPAITAAAILGLGQVLYRLDRDDEAMAAWKRVIALGETPSAYQAWRQVAAARVREGDLLGATDAYREADRRAPAADKAEIASRLGWLAKETGDPRGARRYFARSRGTTGLPIPLTHLIIIATVIVSLTASTADGQDLLQALWLDKAAVAAGEWWRLVTVTLVHAPIDVNPLHLVFNMYALYLVGPIVERIYGWKLLGLMYVLCAIAGSVGSFLFGGLGPSVGASGAIFGLFGVVLAATRIHDPVLDRRGRALVGQIGTLIVINLVFGFSSTAVGGNIDNAAHVGGLLAGLWLGLVLVPGNVRTVRDLWQMPAGASGSSGASGPGNAGGGREVALVRLLAVAALVVVLLVGLALGSDPSRFGNPGLDSAAEVAAVRASRRPPVARVPRSRHRSAPGSSSPPTNRRGRGRRAPRTCLVRRT
jgi:membrane associated rhomboid family serine protease